MKKNNTQLVQKSSIPVVPECFESGVKFSNFSGKVTHLKGNSAVFRAGLKNHSTVQYGTVQCLELACASQCSTVEYIIVQCDIVQCSTVQ